ncbi:DUF4097 domain-containing protein [Streptomyces kaniharaensis]|uniref:DUF4097 domain-containing protein n=1 Tax=Streptomyces kaniharaensis TaxID=212423 RepID=A0A6N7KQP4_9ACTN|nr:DUF4097 family beta strand repeat-containing protein [Streptomyces kaniharaensis]MQS12394.1 DUF4097 domain-containing protein [Streptomyces kaniharaensis]
MPTYETTGPITAVIEFDIASVRVSASKRTDVVVHVAPATADVELDVKAAQQTKVDFAGGRLTLKGPRKRNVFGRVGSVEVLIELPAGSEVHGDAPLANFVTEGPLGDCRLKTSLGRIQVEHAANAWLKTDHGDVRLESSDGDAEVSGLGRIEIGTVGGTLTVKNSNGDTEVAEVHGNLKVNSSFGRIEVGTAHAGVDAKTANGPIRIGRVERGQVTLQTSLGDLEVGIAEGTAAWLDIHSKVGRLRNQLGAAAGPGEARETVEVRGHTELGDIEIRRS